MATKQQSLVDEWDDDVFEAEFLGADEGTCWRIEFPDRETTTGISFLAYFASLDPEVTVEEVSDE